MNANSKPLAPTIDRWLHQAKTALQQNGVLSARLDSELILSHVLNKSRTWLIAHQNDTIIDLKVLENASKLLEDRLNRIPLAYITHKKEFYGREFFVNQSVLIPRPESETMVDVLKELVESFEEEVTDQLGSLIEMRSAASVASEDSRIERVNPARRRFLDVGTGSGCLGITAKLEFPQLSVTVSDISKAALTVARKNARILKATPISFIQSDLLEHWLSQTKHPKFDVIIANLPYVSSKWEQSPEIAHEPSLALYARDNGMALIKKCIQQSRGILSQNGILLMEADPCQHQEILDFADNIGFSVCSQPQDYIISLQYQT